MDVDIAEDQEREYKEYEDSLDLGLQEAIAADDRLMELRERGVSGRELSERHKRIATKLAGNVAARKKERLRSEADLEEKFAAGEKEEVSFRQIYEQKKQEMYDRSKEVKRIYNGDSKIVH